MDSTNLLDQWTADANETVIAAGEKVKFLTNFFEYLLTTSSPDDFLEFTKKIYETTMWTAEIWFEWIASNGDKFITKIDSWELLEEMVTTFDTYHSELWDRLDMYPTVKAQYEDGGILKTKLNEYEYYNDIATDTEKWFYLKMYAVQYLGINPQNFIDDDNKAQYPWPKGKAFILAHLHVEWKTIPDEDWANSDYDVDALQKIIRIYEEKWLFDRDSREMPEVLKKCDPFNVLVRQDKINDRYYKNWELTTFKLYDIFDIKNVKTDDLFVEIISENISWKWDEIKERDIVLWYDNIDAILKWWDLEKTIALKIEKSNYESVKETTEAAKEKAKQAFASLSLWFKGKKLSEETIVDKMDLNKDSNIDTNEIQIWMSNLSKEELKELYNYIHDDATKLAAIWTFNEWLKTWKDEMKEYEGRLTKNHILIYQLYWNTIANIDMDIDWELNEVVMSLIAPDITKRLAGKTFWNVKLSDNVEFSRDNGEKVFIAKIEWTDNWVRIPFEDVYDEKIELIEKEVVRLAGITNDDKSQENVRLTGIHKEKTDKLIAEYTTKVNNAIAKAETAESQRDIAISDATKSKEERDIALAEAAKSTNDKNLALAAKDKALKQSEEALLAMQEAEKKSQESLVARQEAEKIAQSRLEKLNEVASNNEDLKKEKGEALNALKIAKQNTVEAHKLAANTAQQCTAAAKTVDETKKGNTTSKAFKNTSNNLDDAIEATTGGENIDDKTASWTPLNGNDQRRFQLTNKTITTLDLEKAEALLKKYANNPNIAQSNEYIQLESLYNKAVGLQNLLKESTESEENYSKMKKEVTPLQEFIWTRTDWIFWLQSANAFVSKTNELEANLIALSEKAGNRLFEWNDNSISWIFHEGYFRAVEYAAENNIEFKMMYTSGHSIKKDQLFNVNVDDSLPVIFNSDNSMSWNDHYIVADWKNSEDVFNDLKQIINSNSKKR